LSSLSCVEENSAVAGELELRQRLHVSSSRGYASVPFIFPGTNARHGNVSVYLQPGDPVYVYVLESKTLLNFFRDFYSLRSVFVLSPVHLYCC
jgi:hypothetical protein